MNYLTYEVRVYETGTKEWYLNGQYHREDGPAVECKNGARFWYLNGKRHREDGPAIEYPDGGRLWYLNGEQLTEQEFLKRTTPVKEMSIEEIQKILGYKIKITE